MCNLVLYIAAAGECTVMGGRAHEPLTCDMYHARSAFARPRGARG
eukprot:COSAG01_NODE_36094_length_522_cov_1.087470_1_plen_44_part_01